MRAYIQVHGLGKVFFSPIDVFLPSGSIVQPDIIFISSERLSIIQNRIEGIPDLCVEVVSPTGAERDRIVKRQLYAENGVREYWIIDDESKSVEVLTLDGTDYAPAGYFLTREDNADTVRSVLLPEFALSCAQVFRDTL